MFQVTSSTKLIHEDVLRRSDPQASGEIKKKFFMSIQGEMGTALVMSYLYSRLSKFTIISGLLPAQQNFFPYTVTGYFDSHKQPVIVTGYF